MHLGNVEHTKASHDVVTSQPLCMYFAFPIVIVFTFLVMAPPVGLESKGLLRHWHIVTSCVGAPRLRVTSMHLNLKPWRASGLHVANTNMHRVSTQLSLERQRDHGCTSTLSIANISHPQASTQPSMCLGFSCHRRISTSSPWACLDDHECISAPRVFNASQPCVSTHLGSTPRLHTMSMHLDLKRILTILSASRLRAMSMHLDLAPWRASSSCVVDAS